MNVGELVTLVAAAVVLAGAVAVMVAHARYVARNGLR